jgi:dienelactone hydrolase
MLGTLYRPGSGPPGSGVILVHGVNETGKDDERIVWLADLLARAGFSVLTPDFLGFKTLTLRASDVEELTASIRYLAREAPGVQPGPVGLIGFSYGAGPTLIAASDAGVREAVRFVVSFGGYYDLQNVITFITTGHYEYGPLHGQSVPSPYSRWIFLHYNLELIESPRDRMLLREIATGKRRNPRLEAGLLVEGLSPEGRAIYELMENRDPEQVPDLLRRLPSALQGQIRFLSPSRLVRGFPGRLYVVHSDPDDYIPVTESLRLAAAMEGSGNVRLTLLRTFDHVRPDFPPLTPGSLFRIYLPEGARLFGLVSDLLKQRHVQ